MAGRNPPGTPSSLREYVLHLLKSNRFQDHPYTPVRTDLLSSASVHGHVRTVRASFGWLVNEALTEVNIAKDLKPPKVVTRVVSTLSDEEIACILKSFTVTSSSEVRNQTIFMLLLDTGLRMGELIGLKMADMHMDDGFIKVLGKGKRERIVPVGNNAQRTLQRYIFRFRPEPANLSVDQVFLTSDGNPLSESGVRLMFTRLAQRSGVQRLHAHLCRHRFATRFLVNGGDVFTLQQILGHSTLEMVRRYVNLASSHVTMQHRKFSPVDRLNLRAL